MIDGRTAIHRRKKERKKKKVEEMCSIGVIQSDSMLRWVPRSKFRTGF